MGFFERYFVEKLKIKAMRDPAIKSIVDEYNSTPAIPAEIDERLEREFKEIRENAKKEADKEWPERQKALYAEFGLDENGHKIWHDDDTGERYTVDYNTKPHTYHYPPGFRGTKHIEKEPEKVPKDEPKEINTVQQSIEEKEDPVFVQERIFVDVTNGLIQLGCKKLVADKLVRQLARASPTPLTAEELMSLALKSYKK